jgi:heptosyltransferase II
MPDHPPSKILYPRRILVRGTNWLGDAVMSTPAMMRLRERFPDTHIALLTHEKMRDLWLHHPAVNETIGFGAREGNFSIVRKLRAGHFDLALVLPNSPRSALEVWLAGIPQRIGYARPWRNAFLTQVVPTRPGHVAMHKRTESEIKQLVAADVSPRQNPESRVLTNTATTAHQIHEYLHLVGMLGANPQPLAPQLTVADDEIQSALAKFALTEVVKSGQPLLALNPGAEYGPAKRWPAERFIAVANEVQRQTNCICLVLGGKGDVDLATTIADGITHHAPRTKFNLAGKTSLRELMALLKSCRVMLTNDTGPMHVAAALGTPVVVPFGSTSPELTGPGLPGDSRHRLIKSDAPCSPCFLRECPIDFRCMNGISVERVVQAVVQALQR